MDTHTDKYLTPPTVAKRWGVAVHKVLAAINRGELEALNLADDPNGSRPRWHIAPEAIERFERRRSNLARRITETPALKRPRANVTEYV